MFGQTLGDFLSMFEAEKSRASSWFKTLRDDIVSAFEQNLVPAMKNFNPDFILVSSGFDGHKDDLLGGLSYTSNGYKSVATILTELANKYADGRIMFMLEGGYTSSSTNASIIAVLEALTETNK
mgnify:CR=1 FL=1